MKEIYNNLFKLINNRPIFKDINNGSYYYNNKIEAPISIKIKNELLSIPCLPSQLNEIISNNNNNNNSLNSDSIEILKNKIYDNSLNQALNNNIKNGLGIKINEEITLKLNKLVIQNSNTIKNEVKEEEEDNQHVFGKLILIIPSKFKGGEIIVYNEQDDEKVELNLSYNENSPLEMEYIAFYSNCKFNFKEIKSGNKVYLIYDLICKSNKLSSNSLKSSKIKHYEGLKKISNELNNLLDSSSKDEDGVSKLIYVYDKKDKNDNLFKNTIESLNLNKEFNIIGITGYLENKEVITGWANYNRRSDSYDFCEKSSKTLLKLKDFEELSGRYNLSFGEEWKAQDDEIMNDYSIDDYDSNESSDTDQYQYDGSELEDKIRTYNIEVIVIFKRNQIFQVIDKFINKDTKNLSKYKQSAIDYLLDLEKLQNGSLIDNEQQGANLILDLLKFVKPILASKKDNSYIPTWFNKSIKEIAPNQVKYIKKERLKHFKLYPLEFIKNLKNSLNHFTEQDIIESINNLKVKNEQESIGSSDKVDSVLYIFDHYLLPAYKLNPDKVTKPVLEIFIQKFIENKVLPNKLYYHRSPIKSKPIIVVQDDDEFHSDDSYGSFRRYKKQKTNSTTTSKVTEKPPKPEYEIITNCLNPLSNDQWSNFNLFSSSFSKSFFNNLISSFKESLINTGQPNTKIYKFIKGLYNGISTTKIDENDKNQFKQLQNEYFQIIIDKCKEKELSKFQVLENWLSLFDLQDRDESYNQQLVYSNFIFENYSNQFHLELFKLLSKSKRHSKYYNLQFREESVAAGDDDSGSGCLFNFNSFLNLWKKTTISNLEQITNEIINNGKIKEIYCFKILDKSFKPCNYSDCSSCSLLIKWLKSPNETKIELRTLARERKYLEDALKPFKDCITYTINNDTKQTIAEKKNNNLNDTSKLYYLDFKMNFLDNLNLLLNVTTNFIPSKESDFKLYDKELYDNLKEKTTYYNNIILTLLSKEYKKNLIKI